MRRSLRYAPQLPAFAGPGRPSCLGSPETGEPSEAHFAVRGPPNFLFFVFVGGGHRGAAGCSFGLEGVTDLDVDLVEDRLVLFKEAASVVPTLAKAGLAVVIVGSRP